MSAAVVQHIYTYKSPTESVGLLVFAFKYII